MTTPPPQPPTTITKEHHDSHYDYLGYSTQPAFCDLLIRWFGGEGEEDERIVVVFTELSENTGTSVTNRSEHLATCVCRVFDLDPTRTIFLEHYPERGKIRSLLECYALLTYTWQKGEQRALRRATKPRWHYIPLEEAEQLLAEARKEEEHHNAS